MGKPDDIVRVKTIYNTDKPLQLQYYDFTLMLFKDFANSYITYGKSMFICPYKWYEVEFIIDYLLFYFSLFLKSPHNQSPQPTNEQTGIKQSVKKWTKRIIVIAGFLSSLIKIIEWVINVFK